YEEFRDGRSPYKLILEGRGKYQYPPTALLPIHASANNGFRGAEGVAKGTPFNKWISWASRLAVFSTIGVSILVMLLLSARLTSTRPQTRDAVVASVAFGAAGL